MKYLLIISLTVTTLLAICNAQSHSVAWGSREQGDRLLQRRVIEVKAGLFRIMKKEFLFQQKPYAARITQIVVIDRKKYGYGGYASLLAGGPQNTYVKLLFKSQRGRAMDFVVYIYGI